MKNQFGEVIRLIEGFNRKAYGNSILFYSCVNRIMCISCYFAWSKSQEKQFKKKKEKKQLAVDSYLELFTDKVNQ